MTSLQSILQEQKLKLEGSTPAPGTAHDNFIITSGSRFGYWRWVWWMFATVTIIIVVFWLIKRKSSKQSA
jgi:hypothetical protein